MKVLNVDVRCHELINEIYCEPKRGVEVGVYKAQLSWRLLAANKHIFLYLVDPWRETTDADTWRETDDFMARLSQQEHDAVMAEALAEVAIFKDRYEVIRETSEAASRRFEDETLDFVFIDGDHSYSGVRLDIACWFPKLKRGGLLSGHDYRDEANFGVKRAVNEFAKATDRTLRLGANYTWFITK